MSARFQSKSSAGKSSNSTSGHRSSADVAGSRLSLPLNYGGLGNIFFEQLSNEADKILQVDTIHNVTENKGSVKVRGIQLAIEMKSRGVRANDIILICSKTHSHQTIVLLATLFLGAIVCPISPEEPFKECLEIVRKLKPKMYFCDTRTVSQIDRILQNLNMGAEIVNFGNEVAGTTQFVKLFPFKEEIEFRPIFINNPHKEVAFVIPTPGTSGEPKLVCLSHHNIYIQGLNFMELFENPAKIISFFPLSWVTETIIACASLEYGVTRIMAPSFNERGACKMIHDFVIDVAVLGTELAMRLTGNVAVKDFNLSCLKCALVGVVNTSPEDLSHMRQALPTVKFLNLYTLTETGCIAAVPSSNYSAGMAKPSSVGKLLKNCRIKILDIETRQPLPCNQFGELYFKGDGLMLGYFRDQPGTMPVFEKGYFKTGDLAKYDEEGWIYLQGRIENMILVNGVKVSPMHFEDCILAHPFVHDVVIIGNQNEVVACIEKKPNSQLTSDHISTFIAKAMPEQRKLFSRIVFFDEFPRTCAGHVKKNELREKVLEVQLEYTGSLASITSSVRNLVSNRSLTKP